MEYEVLAVAPHDLQDYNIVIATDVYFDEIKKQLTEEFGIEEERIKSANYLFKNIKTEIISRYKDSCDESIIGICRYLQTHDLDMFSGQVRREYKRDMFEVFQDENNGLFYSFWMGKKIYLASAIDSKQSAKQYLCALCREQDEDSPHSYHLDKLALDGQDVVIDGGAAEGFFALQIIDRVGKIYLVEGEEQWVKALRCTFEPYGDKAVIIPKWLGSQDNGDMISIDRINKENKVTLVKLDIEGAEADAIAGGEETFTSAQNMKVITCTYHKSEDADRFEGYFKEKGYKTSFSKGYLFVDGLEFMKPELRKGVLTAMKGHKNL
ncbi:hypothetical protein IMSAGC009_02038 [Lachnospiraceae bacterium]|nr:hypothetical protein IMSAGC009_02038 [Lachnospiraceae bacterium]